jgi:inosine/xanthosine triphosphatase
MAFPKRKNFQAEKRQLLIIVGSKNPVKIKCTDSAFHQAFEETFLIEGLNVGSDVSSQPVGDEETFRGARNRALNSKAVFPEADYWVGIEGGVEEVGEEMQAFAWVVIVDSAGKIGKAKTATFFLPPAITALIKGGMELGDADDHFFEREQSKIGNGAVGILTKDLISRKDYYTPAVILALIPFMNPEIYS